MKRTTGLLMELVLTAAMLLGAACNTGTEATPKVGANTGGTNNMTGGFTNTGALGSFTSADLASFANSIAPALGQVSSNQQAGIWVTGLGKVTLAPDLALLSLGVEVRANTVEAARAEAAAAMTGIIEALKARGIADKDIQTRYFNIYPEYTYQDVYENGGRYGKQILTGYRVSNTVTAKIRDLDIVGATIDDVVRAGGDVTRINSIQFTVEDASAAQMQARESAVLDALAKADQFATLTGVTRGNLLFITESGSSVPQARSFDGMEAAVFADSAVTPVSAGELELQVSVQAVFAIGSP
ncbi:MAG: SIMPL domain-containing protein [Chloroflexi bacterium]|nr:SIMPL domain-containing protein [Chloroflexota bacterium]